MRGMWNFCEAMMKMAKGEKPFATPGKTYGGVLGSFTYVMAINEKGIVCIKFTPQ